jgi:hypothetical protein
MLASIVSAGVLVLLWAARTRTFGKVLAWPGTVLHELSHFLVALITGSKPQTLRLWPERDAEGVTLGSVSFCAGWLTAGIVALAPLAMLAPAAVWLLVVRPAATLHEEAVAGVLAAYCLHACWPSRADWLIAFRHPVGSAIVLAVLLMFAASTWQALQDWLAAVCGAYTVCAL